MSRYVYMASVRESRWHLVSIDGVSQALCGHVVRQPLLRRCADHRPVDDGRSLCEACRAVMTAEGVASRRTAYVHTLNAGENPARRAFRHHGRTGRHAA